ncbi:2-isopropylmalate synthase [Annulohypoxylon maeteangense]|uniref:2-isopropylmalate synthase n=1 Tax=Annulohypoxylon maeteangense TaxID=1927788 RepID=UPI002007F18E|nr:2-isopropylmalate synthase [Annulohypoxylon maeteangense]KAI0881676.1 2-isopropylmalate synthase [Annulohypoxylon maeteangense]
MPAKTFQKYDPFPALSLSSRKWPDNSITKPPRWLSTDLRDGNQALVQPMDSEAKRRYFQALVKLGYKEIEISYPAASQTEWDFTRELITTPGAIPDDVRIQVMAPCREDLIRRTIEAARGARSAIVHIHLSTSRCFREVVFNMTENEMKDLAVRCTRLIRELTKESTDPEIRSTEWTLQFCPENFQDTSIEYALEICEAVKATWQPTQDNPIIFNLTATVEVAMPNVFADQIEYFCTHITEREKVCVSLHNHNDRGSAVAAAELGLLAGADRIEGCLFGNGERTGNVDLVTLAMNLHTQGIYSGIDFSDVKSVVAMVEELTKVPVHVRAPYAGAYTFCTFSGSHQDAIRKGYKARAKMERKLGKEPKWVMPYLAMDPADLGREHEAIIRINSQCGKGGIGWLVEELFGIKPPRELEIAFTKICKAHADDMGIELTHGIIENLFRSRYMQAEGHGGATRVKVQECEIGKHNTNGANDTNGTHFDGQALKNGYSNGHGKSGSAYLRATIAAEGGTYDLCGTGSDVLASVLDSMRKAGSTFELLVHESQNTDNASEDIFTSKTAIMVKLGTSDRTTAWGVGIHERPEWSTLQAVSLRFLTLACILPSTLSIAYKIYVLLTETQVLSAAQQLGVDGWQKLQMQEA